MKKSLLVPATGVAALALSVTLAGCGSGSKTASSSTASAASTATSSAASASSTTDTAHKVAVTLPEIPGWSDDVKIEFPFGGDMLASIKHGDDASIIVVALTFEKGTFEKGDDMAKYLRDAVVKESELGGDCKMGDPAPATMSGYSGFVNTCLGGQLSQTRASFGVPETTDAPASMVQMIGGSANSFFDQAKEAFNQIIEEGTIVP